MFEVKGWRIAAHPLFVDQFVRLIEAVERDRRKDSEAYRRGANAKLQAAILKLILDTIPANPDSAEFRQGTTLGKQHLHWFRAKFGGGRFRLFFRYSSAAKIIIYVWVNDRDSLRTYGSKTDAYAVFRRMLAAGNPPDDWKALQAEAENPVTEERLQKYIQITARSAEESEG